MEDLKAPKAAPIELTVRQIGGSAEGLTQVLPGDARFIAGVHLCFVVRGSSGS
jgi:hypothetical protein